MPLPAKKQKHIIDLLGDLPPEKVDEIIDFAEYLKKKKVQKKSSAKKAPQKVPAFHLGKVRKQATDRNKLYGDHLDRKLD